MKAPDRRQHWQDVYRAKSETAVSWYRPHLDASLRLIEATGVGPCGRVIDIGGGTSTLVDDLLAHGHTAITVLDLSDEAIARSRQRLGADAARVNWLVGDVVDIGLPAAGFDLWHDRAALHFLVDAEDRRGYARQLRTTVAPGGHVILATFALDGPERCSDLPVRRYDAALLQELVGSDFSLRRATRETHTTPAGTPQAFTYCWFQRRPRACG